MTPNPNKILGLLPDHEINRLNIEHKMISPSLPSKVEGTPSHGLSSYGYDIRLGPRYITSYLPAPSTILTPENLKEEMPNLVRHNLAEMGELIFLMPGQFCLAHSLETFDMPTDITGFVKDKSTYARMGVAVQNTVIEPGWRGTLTLEITNHAQWPVGLLVGSGIAQISFVRGVPCDKPYSPSGKYQDQKNVTLPK